MAKFMIILAALCCSMFLGSLEGSEFARCPDMEKASSRGVLIGEMNSVQLEISRLGNLSETIQETISQLRTVHETKVAKLTELDTNMSWIDYLLRDLEDEIRSSGANSTRETEYLATIEEIMSQMRIADKTGAANLTQLINLATRLHNLLGNLVEGTLTSDEPSTSGVEDLAVNSDDEASKVSNITEEVAVTTVVDKSEKVKEAPRAGIPECLVMSLTVCIVCYTIKFILTGYKPSAGHVVNRLVAVYVIFRFLMWFHYLGLPGTMLYSCALGLIAVGFVYV